MKRAGRVAAVAVAVALGPPAAGYPPKPGTADSCRVVAFSPVVATDRTGLCVGYLIDYDDVVDFRRTLALQVYLTRDAGRTWTPTAGAGLLADDRTHLGGLAFSPAYATDHTVYLQTTDQGVLASVDLGASWHPVAAQATAFADAFVTLPPLVAQPVPGLEPAAVALVSGDADDEMSVTQGFAHVPVPGSPGDDRELLVPAGFPDRPAYAVADEKGADPNSTQNHAALFRCDAQLRCDQRVYAWPRGTAVVRAWLAPDFATSKTMYVVTTGPTARMPMQAWLSTDAGATFSRWRSVDAVLGRVDNGFGNHVAVGLGMVRGSRTYYLHVAMANGFWWTPRRTPPHQVFRSDDRGAHWRRVAYANPDGKGGLKGNLPFFIDHGLDRRRLADLTLLPDGRLFATGGRVDTAPVTYELRFTYGVWCSVDGGATWAERCAR